MKHLAMYRIVKSFHYPVIYLRSQLCGQIFTVCTRIKSKYLSIEFGPWVCPKYVWPVQFK